MYPALIDTLGDAVIIFELISTINLVLGERDYGQNMVVMVLDLLPLTPFGNGHLSSY